MLGAGAGDNLGFTVASGDVNGDGIDDALVGARFAANGERLAAGAAYAVFGRPDLGGTLDVAEGGQDLTVVGANAGDFWSFALASGDTDGDGIDDLILGASAADGPDGLRDGAGTVAVVPGSPQLAGRIELAPAGPFFIVHGARAGDSLPNTVAAGDFDGDGKDELLLGAPFATTTAVREKAGAAYIVDVPDGPSALDLAAQPPLASLTGGDLRDGLGFFVAAGDVNGDGIADAVIGARDADGAQNSRNNAGEVHVLFGATQLPPALDLASASTDITVTGADATDSLGFTVATGDLNGDGLRDVLTGAPVADGCQDSRTDSGEVYVIAGRLGFNESLDVSGGGFDRVLYGAEAGDELGFSLVAGDVNGDGRDDIITGALQADGPDNTREDAGQVFIVLSR